VLHAINQWIVDIGASPYAVFLGLVLAAIPIVFILGRWLWSTGGTVLQIARKGFSSQRRAAAKKDVKQARKLVRESAFIRYYLHNIWTQISFVGLFTLYLVFVVSLWVLFSPSFAAANEIMPPEKTVFLLPLILSAQLMVTIVVRAKRFRRIIRLRDRYVRRGVTTTVNRMVHHP